MPTSTSLREAYASLLAACHRPGVVGISTSCQKESLQGQWAAGFLLHEGETRRHGHVSIIDPGIWNRGEGPDFLQAEIELNGKRIKGDIVLDIHAHDWERLGYDCNPAFEQVILHLVLNPPDRNWYTRNAAHKDVPLLCLISTPTPGPADLCPCPLASMSAVLLDQLLQAAAAYRLHHKKLLFQQKVTTIGENQSWYEAWAETLGYRSNKLAMLTLARRAPLQELGGRAEAILFGTAGFLTPTLPPQTTQEARRYHRSVWDAWWPLREQYGLEGSHRIPWILTPIRPLNHPHRRVAALALIAQRWSQIFPLLQSGNIQQLENLLAHLAHPYWSYHCTLPSQALRTKAALIGQECIQAFLINHLFALHNTETRWQTYLSLRAPTRPTRLTQLAHQLMGERQDTRAILARCYAQQGLLQLQADFSSPTQGELFPSQLTQWQGL